MNTQLRLITSPHELRACLKSIHAIADSEKEALGFIPHGAYEDAIDQRRLLAARNVSGTNEVDGFVLFGSTFPNARVQQIGVRNGIRRTGVGSFLLSELISKLEGQGYLTVKARVASDLPVAQAFYARHGFEEAAVEPGGQARQREIVVRVRHLETPSLIDAWGGAVDWASAEAPPLSLRRLATGEAPFYTIDLNVLFDLIRDRDRSRYAQRLFNAALSHAIRVAAANEFVAELERTSADQSNDPLLRLAMQLPRLPKVDEAEITALANQIHAEVFEASSNAGAGSAQARSDCRHIAHAIMARASGFITSDKTLLAARGQLLSRRGIDVASLEDLVSLLPSGADAPTERTYGEGFSCRPVSAGEASSHLASLGASSDTQRAFGEDAVGRQVDRLGIFERDALVALGVLSSASSMDQPANLLVQVPQHNPAAELFAEYLFDIMLGRATSAGPAALHLHRLPGQTLIGRIAEAKGFFESGGLWSKIALGRPLTVTTWEDSATQVRRRVGVVVAKPDEQKSTVEVIDSEGRSHWMEPLQLEALLSPTIVARPQSDAVIVSIKKVYADELLGTSDQNCLPLLEHRAAAFLTRRAYISSPRNAPLLRPERAILFYESDRSGGRGAVVAVGRIVDSLIQQKGAVPEADKRRVVVGSFDEFSSSEDVLVTTFDQILRFPRVISRRDLEQLNALPTNNLQSAAQISAESFRRILDAAWSNA